MPHELSSIIISRYNSNCKGETLGNRTMTEVGIDHMRDKIQMEEKIEASVTVDPDQVQEQVQIGTGLDVSSAESMTIS